MSYELGASPRKAYVRYTGHRAFSPAEAAALGDLDFSLKPPKWLRKAKLSDVVRGVGIAAGAVAGAILLAPVAGAVGRAAVSGAKAVAGLVVPKAGTKVTLPVKALSKAATDAFDVPEPRRPESATPVAIYLPNQGVFDTTARGSAASEAAAYQTPFTYSEAAPELVGPPAPKVNPLLIGGLVVAGLAAASSMGRH